MDLSKYNKFYRDMLSKSTFKMTYIIHIQRNPNAKPLFQYTADELNQEFPLGNWSTGGDTDLWGVGIIPAVASVETAVGAKLPDDTIFDKVNYVESKNTKVFSCDNGKGQIVGGEATGTINYTTGALNITGPPMSEFVVSFNHDSAYSGGVNATASQQNSIRAIAARSMNSKIDAEVEIIGLI